MIRARPAQQSRMPPPGRAAWFRARASVRLPRAALAVALLAGLLLPAGAFLAGCTTEAPPPTTEERFPYIQDPNFKLKNPSRARATATGIGCGGSEVEALVEARRTAHYNLRGVTGNETYRVEYLLLREVPREGLHCVEVEARAVP